MPRVYTKKANRGATRTKVCIRCHQPIEPTQMYKMWSPRLGRSSTTKYMHAEHGSPTQSELYPYNKMSPLYDAQTEADDALGKLVPDYGDPGDENFDAASFIEAVQEVLNNFAETVRGVGEEYAESGQNIEDGFGHETYQAAELKEKGEALDSWASDLEDFDPSNDSGPDFEIDTDLDEDELAQAWIEAVDEWAGEVIGEASEKVNDCPV